jgi:hypothetical protein
MLLITPYPDKAETVGIAPTHQINDGHDLAGQHITSLSYLQRRDERESNPQWFYPNLFSRQFSSPRRFVIPGASCQNRTGRQLPTYLMTLRLQRSSGINRPIPQSRLELEPNYF